MLIDTHAHLGQYADHTAVAGHLDRFGLDQVWLHGRVCLDQAACLKENSRILQQMEQDPRTKGFCALHPSMGAAALTTLAQCLDAGMLGAGEFHPAVQGFALDDPNFHAIAGLLEQRGGILGMYLEGSVGATRETCSIRSFAEFMENYPKLKVLLVNYGGGLPFYELMKEIRSRLGNVCYDTSPALRAQRKDACQITAMVAGNHKLTFGSGACIGDAQAPIQPVSFEELGLTDAELRQAVACKNALRLCGKEVQA